MQVTSRPYAGAPDLRRMQQLVGRVEAQWAAFAPSDLLLEWDVRARQRWRYRPTLDRIVVTDGGVGWLGPSTWMAWRLHVGNALRWPGAPALSARSA